MGAAATAVPAAAAVEAGESPTGASNGMKCEGGTSGGIQGMRRAASSEETESMEAAAERAAATDTASPSSPRSTELGITAAITVGMAGMTAGTTSIPLKEGWK